MDLKFKNNSKLSIPYIEIEYLESETNQYIDTGVKISPTMGVFVDFQFTQLITGNQALFGYIDSRSSGGSYTKNFSLYTKNDDTNEYQIVCTPNSTVNTGIFADTNRHTLKFNITNKVVEIDDGDTYSTTLTSAPTKTADQTCVVFGRRHTNSSGVRSWGIGSFIRIYKFQIYDNGTLYKNFIPVLDNNGVPCMYETTSETFFYNAGTGNFVYSHSFVFANLTSIFLQNCPNICGLQLLKSSNSLTRIRLDIGNISGSIQELMSYSTLNGFNDDYEPQVKPRLVGTWTINSYYTTAEKEAATAAFDGLTIIDDSNYLVDNLIEQDAFAIQTLDPDKPNYNPAAAILLNSKGTATTNGHTLSIPLISGGGKWFITKTDASAITSVGTIFRGETTVTDTEGIVSSDTTAEYDFESFDELGYFGITSIAAGSSTSDLGGFGGCIKLERIILPETVTTIGKYSFYDCNKLESINIPRGLTANIGEYAFYNCKSIINFDSPRGNGISAFRGTSSAVTTYQFGCGTGIFLLHGGLGTTSIYATRMYFKKIIVTGFTWNVTNALTVLANTIVRISGTITDSANSGPGFTKGVVFLEFTTLSLSNATNNRLFASGGTQEVFIRRADLLPSGTPTNFGNGTVSKFYVGLGENASDDNATLQLYLNDTNWGTVSTKLDTWYNYNGQYKWYYVTATLSNCTSTNPDSWYTHPTRGESYETTIVPDEGMTLDSVTVEMLDTDTTSTTYDTMVDITSSVYDSSTGEINIPSVTGNVVITASAS